MNNRIYESSEFYSYKYKNFATIIIIPIAVLMLMLFLGSFFAIRQNVVISTGVIEPVKLLNVSGNYQEGQIVNKDKHKWQVHLDDKNPKIAYLMPNITSKGKIKMIIYVPEDKISEIKKSQKVSFPIPNSSGKTNKLIGKVKTVAIYPINFKSGMYEITCEAQANPKLNVRYGMEGKATIITGKSTYFEYLRDKVLNRN